MTDLLRHSEGYWRSVYIFAEIPDQDMIRDKVVEVLEGLGIEYSYCHYGEVHSPIEDLREKAHITFRINFPSTLSIQGFQAWLKSKKWEWEDHNYDEALWVKKAYVLGTRLYKEAFKESRSPDVQVNQAFLRIMFHGFFNDMHYTRKEEIEFYHYLFDSMMGYLFAMNQRRIDRPT